MNALSNRYRLKLPLILPLLTLILSIGVFSTGSLASNNESHAITLYGDPKYDKDFRQFDYTSPKAVKGGSIVLHSLGTFDTFNPFTPKGNAADGIDLLYSSLTVGSSDEAATQYGLVAEEIIYPDNREWVEFEMNPEAKFHDGTVITADDVVFSYNLLIEKGSPAYRLFFGDVTAVKALDNHRVRFEFKKEASRELALSVGTLPIFPQHYWATRDFSKTSLEPPLGSGPYKIKSFDAGRRIVYERVDDYWAKNHPTQLGSYNFDEITYDYYRDDIIAMEAFKAGEYEVRRERISKLWATAYTGSLFEDGDIQTREIAHQNPTGMQAFIFNTRREVFKDKALRKAIALAFDFEWTNKNLFYGAYTRTQSYFSNSDMASQGLPSDGELEILNQYKDQLPETIFTEAFKAPLSTGANRNRENLKKAKKILDDSGYKVVKNQLINPATGSPVQFEILLYDVGFERVTNPFVQGLKKLGIEAGVRIVDTSQYIRRVRTFDFDMMVHVFSQSSTPGNEQFNYWHSRSKDQEGSGNLIGISDPVIDDIVERITKVGSYQELVDTSRALDRVLLNHHYVIPHWHIRFHRVAYWNRFNQPDIAPIYDRIYDVGLMSWWSKEAETASQQEPLLPTATEIKGESEDTPDSSNDMGIEPEEDSQ